jgi:hypothetical protein
MLGKSLIHAFFKIVKPLIDMPSGFAEPATQVAESSTKVAESAVIYQNADQNGQGRQSGADSRDYYLSEWAHGTN